MKNLTDTLLSRVDHFVNHVGLLNVLVGALVEKVAPQASAKAMAGYHCPACEWSCYWDRYCFLLDQATPYRIREGYTSDYYSCYYGGESACHYHVYCGQCA